MSEIFIVTNVEGANPVLGVFDNEQAAIESVILTFPNIVEISLKQDRGLKRKSWLDTIGTHITIEKMPIIDRCVSLLLRQKRKYVISGEHEF